MFRLSDLLAYLERQSCNCVTAGGKLGIANLLNDVNPLAYCVLASSSVGFRNSRLIGGFKSLTNDALREPIRGRLQVPA